MSELAQELGVARGTVYRWRMGGYGPRFLKLKTHVRYRRRDVETWLDELAGADGPEPAA